MPSCDSFGYVDGEAERQVGFLLTPTFSILPFISAVEPLRAANRFSGRALHRWHVFSDDGEPVCAANGMSQAADAAIDDIAAFPTVIVCGPHDPNRFRSAKIENWLRRLARGGTRLGALDTGPYLLAQARLLTDYRCTIHWENLPGFVEAFPGIDVSSEIYEFDRNRFSCGGGTAARIGVSKRQLERLFRRYLASTPARYYMNLRLQLGRQLLEQTAMPLTEVALACGFASPGHFSYRYRALYGLSPRLARCGA